MFDNHFTAESENFTVAPQSVVPQCPLSDVHIVCWLLQFWLLGAAGRGLVRRNPRIPTVHSIVEATRARKILYKRAQSQRQSKYLHITNFICKYPVSVVSRRRCCRRFGWEDSRRTWRLDLDLDLDCFGAALAASMRLYILTLHNSNSGIKEPDKESQPPSPARGYLLGLELALPASGVTIARESALDLGSKLGLQPKKDDNEAWRGLRH